MFRRCLERLAVNRQFDDARVNVGNHRRDGVVAGFAGRFVIGQHPVANRNLADGDFTCIRHDWGVGAEAVSEGTAEILLNVIDKPTGIIGITEQFAAIKQIIDMAHGVIGKTRRPRQFIGIAPQVIHFIRMAQAS